MANPETTRDPNYWRMRTERESRFYVWGIVFGMLYMLALVGLCPTLTMTFLRIVAYDQ